MLEPPRFTMGMVLVGLRAEPSFCQTWCLEENLVPHFCPLVPAIRNFLLRIGRWILGPLPVQSFSSPVTQFGWFYGESLWLLPFHQNGDQCSPGNVLEMFSIHLPRSTY